MSEKFSGHELESGLLQRARSWRDVFPLLVMLASLRVAGSPIYVSLSLLTVVVISTVCSGGLPETELPAMFLRERLQTWIAGLPLFNAWLVPIAIIIALLPMTLTIRAGALYAAGRDGESFTAGFKIIWQRKLTLLLVLALPMLCVVGLSVPIAALALLDRIPGVGDALTEALAIFAVPFAVLIGLVAGGSMTAIPIGWASVTIEKREDAFDALSRGYEYLYRRPIQWMLYVSISIVLATIVGLIAQWVCLVSFNTCEYVYKFASGSESLPKLLCMVLVHLPTAVWMTTFFATWGAVYLLLRQDANQQEIEDLAVTEIDRRENSLPSLKSKSNYSP